MKSGMWVNLLKETLEIFEKYGYREDNVSYVKVPIRNKRFCANISWEEFKENIKDINYDPGYGLQEISGQLQIVFTNGNFLERREYDGSEWWQLVCIPIVGATTVPFDKNTMYIKTE